MNTLPQIILEQARSLPEGHVLSPREYLHLGSRAAVDQAFSRLARQGRLLRVRRGAYVAPVKGRFGARAPAPGKVIASLAGKNHEAVVPHGAAEANALGLTQQVPTREVYLTSGRTRQLKLGAAEVTLRHAPPWMLALGNRPAGAAIRALEWLGEPHAQEALASLENKLPAAEWEALNSARAILPTWMASAIGQASSKMTSHG